jgi:cobalt-zinc-cadmium efflux system membrane fusion protein
MFLINLRRKKCMNKHFKVLLIAAFIVFSGSFYGCGTKEAEEQVQEKAPPDVIQLAPEAIRQSDITTTVTVGSRNVSRQIATTGEIKANENRVFHINSFVTGRVIRDNVFLGDSIHQGQTLALVQNLEVAKVQADYIHELHQNEIEIDQARTRVSLTQKNLERERRLLAEGISPRKDYQQAEAEAIMARQELEGKREHAVHIKTEAKALLGAYGTRPVNPHSERISTSSPVTAPRSGVITKKNITLGDMVTPETVMYEVADLSQTWLDIAVYPKDLSSIRIGQTVSFTTDSLPGKLFIGRINYIQPSADETSQTYIARAYLDNSSGLLKPGMFGQARIEQTTQQTKPFVPEEAVQKYGRENFVFVALGNDRFRKQTVQLGDHISGGYLINSGVQPGDKIVGKGSFVLKAEMLKSQFAEEE